jgi:hypothetical protein
MAGKRSCTKQVCSPSHNAAYAELICAGTYGAGGKSNNGLPPEESKREISMKKKGIVLPEIVHWHVWNPFCGWEKVTALEAVEALEDQRVRLATVPEIKQEQAAARRAIFARWDWDGVGDSTRVA